MLDENTEMHHAIEGLESYEESPLGRSGRNEQLLNKLSYITRPVSPPPIMRKRSKLSIDKDFNSVEIARHQSRRSRMCASSPVSTVSDVFAASQPSLKSARSTPKRLCSFLVTRQYGLIFD